MADIIYTSTNVINGRATVARGTGVPENTAVAWSGSEAVPSGDAYARQGVLLETLYLHHGGDGGSGNWEH